MLELRFGGVESYNDATSEYVMTGGIVLQFEHSLSSLSKWEAVFEKPFLGDGKKTDKEILEYIRLCCITPDVSSDLFYQLTPDHLNSFNEYINKKQTATVIYDPNPRKKNTETVTAELIYYWMISYKIPFECQYWFLNRLLMLVQVCQAKAEAQAHAAKGRKGRMATRAEAAQRAQSRTDLNAARKAQLGSSG